MNNAKKVEKLKRMIELSRFFDYDENYDKHVKKIKKEIKRLESENEENE